MRNINTLRSILNEVFWLLLAVVLTIGFAILILKWEFLSINISFNVGSTYLNLDSWAIIGSLFTFLVFIIYLIKGSVKISEHKSSFYIIFLAGLLFNMLTLHILHSYIQVTSLLPNSTGWTIYPPLSAIPQEMSSIESHLATTPNLLYPISFLQLIVTSLMILVAFNFAKQKAINS